MRKEKDRGRGKNIIFFTCEMNLKMSALMLFFFLNKTAHNLMNINNNKRAEFARIH